MDAPPEGSEEARRSVFPPGRGLGVKWLSFNGFCVAIDEPPRPGARLLIRTTSRARGVSGNGRILVSRARLWKRRRRLRSSTFARDVWPQRAGG